MAKSKKVPLLKEGFKVDFIGVGGERCGTTWLSMLLRQHPQVCFSKKKGTLHFTPYLITGKNFYFDNGLDFYRTYFPEHIPEGKIVGEICPSYMYYNNDLGPQKIFEYFPKVKLIIQIRNPLERLYSDYLYQKDFMGFIPEKMSFKEALEKYPMIKNNSIYSVPLKRYFSRFPREQIFVSLLDDVKKDSADVARRLYKFLGIDENFKPDLSPINQRAIIKYRWLRWLRNHVYHLPVRLYRTKLIQKISPRFVKVQMHKFAVFYGNVDHKITKWNTELAPKPEMDPELEKELKDFYRADIEKVEKIIGRDLSAWKK